MGWRVWELGFSDFRVYGLGISWLDALGLGSAETGIVLGFVPHLQRLQLVNDSLHLGDM